MNRLRVLVAEDDVLVAEDLRQAVQQMGHDVAAVVHRGDEVARTARDHRVDLALLDVRMPGAIDGIDAGRRLRRELEIPVIFVTAYADDPTRQRAEATEPLGYLVKPVDFEELQTAIEIACRRHARERRLREALREEGRRRSNGFGRTDPYRKLFRENPSAIAILTLDSRRILDVNRRFTELFGWTRHDAVGETEDALGLWVRDEDRDRVEERCEKHGRLSALQTSCRARSGHLREVEVSAEVVEFHGDEALLVVFHDVTERAAAESELERLALYDSLTGLPNRNLFRDRLRHALDRAAREERGVGLLFIDVDGFKSVNDSLGHGAGDEVLNHVAHRIVGCVRDEDTVARLGGDEFTVILEEDPTLGGAEEAVRRIQGAMGHPFQLRDETVSLSVSIGVVLSGDGAITAEDLVHFSDMAMYAAKRRGGGGYEVFRADRNPSSTRRINLGRELREALSKDQIVVLYQPIVRLETGSIVGAEALVRWDHPERGVLLPDAWLGALEETDLGAAFGLRVTELACSELMSASNRPPPDFFLSVNMSFFQLSAPGLRDGIVRILDEHAVRPEALMLEVTQDELLRALRDLRRFADAGVRIAVDDFGTGLFRLSHLRSLDMEAVKMDRSFVAGLGEGGSDDAILRSTVVLSRGLGFDVIAEGVETTDQRDRLVAVGCELAQGFHYSRPLKARDFLLLLEAERDGVGLEG